MRYDPRAGITIMLVDTNAKFLEHFSSLLKSMLPYNFITESDGTHALLSAEKTPVHMFLTEAKLNPTLGGFKLLELIKTHEKLAETPVIFVSSLRDKDSIARALSLGVDEYLHKPIEPDKIFKHVVKHINRTVNFKILYADSDEKTFPQVRSIIQNLFPYQVEIFTANSVPAGLNIIDTHEINLLICGNNFPVVTGTRMLTILREQGNLDKIGVIFIPEELSAQDRFTLADLEIEHYLEKPFTDPLEFLETVMSALNVPPIPKFRN